MGIFYTSTVYTKNLLSQRPSENQLKKKKEKGYRQSMEKKKIF